MLDMKVDAHKWVNTIIAAMALIIALAGGFFQLQDYLGKDENLTIRIEPSANIGKVKIREYVPPVLKIPFRVIVSNLSSSTTSIIAYKTYSLLPTGRFDYSENELFHSSFIGLEQPDRGLKATGLLGGGSIVLTALIGIPIENEIGKLILHAFKGKSVSIREIDRMLCKNGLDLLGNKVKAIGKSEECFAKKFIALQTIPIGVVELKTGRDGRFSGRGPWYPFDIN